jgi:hypothetical protein
MSSFLSTAYSDTELQNNFNPNLAAKVLAVKQNKYDVNKAQIEQTLAAYKNQIKGLRDSDNEYIAASLKQVESVINGYGNKDYSLTSTKDTLLGNLRNVTEDPIIRSAILNRAKYDQANAEIAEKKKKNDGSYSDVNYSYMLEKGGFNAYMKGEAKDLGNLQYSNYVDVTKSALEKVKSFKELRGDETIDIPRTDIDGVRRIEKRTIKGLSSSEIFAYMPQILSPEESKQLQINGWSKYQGEKGLELAKETFNSYTKQVQSNLDENILKYEVDYNNKNLTQEDRNKAFKDKTAEEDKKTQYTESFESIDQNSVESIGGFLETVNWKTNFSQMAGAKASVSYDTDTAYYAAANLEIAQQEEARKVERQPYELAKLRQESGVNGNFVSPTGVSLSAVDPEQVDDTQPYDSLLKDFKSQSNNIVATANAVLNGGGIDDNTKESYNLNYNDAIKKGFAPATAAKMAFSRSGMSNLFPEQYANILDEYVRRNDMANVIREADNQILTVFNRNPDKYIDSLKKAVNLAQVAGQSDMFADVENLGEDALKKANAAQAFIDNNGGWNNIKENLLKNPKLIPQFEGHLETLKQRKESASNIFLNPTLRAISISSLKEDSLSERNEAVVKKGQGIVNTASVATVSDPKLAESIINAIPQEDGKVPFDSKQGITYRKTPAGNFQVIQSGAKEGIKGIFGTSRTYEIKPSDDLFKVLNSLTLLETQRRQVSANTYTTPINNENIQYLDKQQKGTIKASSYINNNLGATLESKVNPGFFLTEATTNEVYKERLKGIIAEDKIDSLTSLMAIDTYNKFSVLATPTQGQWTISVELKKGGASLLLKEAETGKNSMDKQLLMFVKQYPQIMVGEALLEYLQENPKEIDTVLNRLK